ncbi:unnamed protein product [Schistosoma margrebowiei]|uniref:Uncharacterized protein n=1 Tax=Schistosoma margrebowiei TaxID=48269 RepID=A0A183M4I4_9TREM|nr:unnamed protein product [Schistosoma margrebowiei]
MESSKPKKEETKNKEYNMPGNGDRHEKNEQELDGIRKEGPGQSGLENAGRRPMLHWESVSSVASSLALKQLHVLKIRKQHTTA